MQTAANELYLFSDLCGASTSVSNAIATIMTFIDSNDVQCAVLQTIQNNTRQC